MRLKDVAEWKNSGMFWSPMIPKFWSVLRFKELFSYTTGVTPDSKNESYFELETGDSWITIGDMNARIVYEGKLGLSAKALSEFQPPITPKGSLLFSFKLSIGKVCFAGKDFYTNEAIASIRPSSKYDLRFWFYYLPLVLHENAIENIYGAKMLNQSIILNMLMAVPPVGMQSKIADYLDEKMAAIDARIAVLEKKIAAYRRLRASIINHTVTRGLDSNVRMKDSGVDWIGKVPEGWKVGRVKDVAIIGNGSDPKTDGDIPVYGSGDGAFKTCGEFKNGPVVLVGRKGATLHIPHYIEGQYWNVDTAFDVRVVSENNLRWFYYQAICFEYRYYMSQTTLPSMTQSDYQNMVIGIPAPVEQRAIADYLDTECAKIDKIAKLVAKEIELYRKLKRSLINELVTGKRKVA